jgi:putative CocE/NonD family hydrolase
VFLPGIFVAGHAGPRDQREVELRRDVLVYTSAPLAADHDVVGTVRASLSVSSSCPETDFSAKLIDVHPDGRAISICDGIARAVAPDPGRPLVVELGATAIRLLAGHRIRLEVSSSNFPRFARNPNSGASRIAARHEDLAVATQRVHHDADRPSSLTLPICPVPVASAP